MKDNIQINYIKKYTFNKTKENFGRNDEIYIPPKPHNNSGKKINIKSKKNIKEIEIKNNQELSYKRALFNKNDNFEYDIISQWKYLSKKYIMNYNKKIMNTNIQIIIQNLKIQKILKNKGKLPTNLIHIINPEKQQENEEINQNFFDEIEKKCEKEDKISKYKGGIESINEEMNESNEDLEEKNSMRSNKIKDQRNQYKKIDELEIKDIESLSYSPMSIKSKDIKFIFNKNINENKINNEKNKDKYLIYKKEINDNKRIKLIFNENKSNNNQRFNININSYKKILKMAFYKKEFKLTKEKYESLISSFINNINSRKKRIKNELNIDNIIEKHICEDIDKKIIEFEESIKELKNIYTSGLNNLQFISNEKDKNIFIKNLGLTRKRNGVKKIYKEIIYLLNNNMKRMEYYSKILDMLKRLEKIKENEINNNTNINIKKNLIKIIFIFTPIIFSYFYFINNFKKI